MKPPVPAIKRLTTINAPGWVGVSRGAALGLSCLLALNLMEIFTYSTSAVDNWFCSLRPLTQPLGLTVLTMATVSFLMYSMKPSLPGPVWFTAIGLVLILAGFCGRELWLISQSVAESLRPTAIARPLGLLMLLAVAGIGVICGNVGTAKGRSTLVSIVFSTGLTVIGFAVVTVQSGGISDAIPEQTVPAILVLGCAVPDDGKPSDALTDRVTTGSRLLMDKHAPRLVLSGSAQEKSGADPDVMKEIAIAAGVPEASISLDSHGSSPAAAIAVLASLPEMKDDRRTIVVSHWYQLARIRLLARRSGLTIVAVASDQEHALFNQNALVAREVGELLKSLCEPAIQFAKRQTQKAPESIDAVD